MKHAWRNGTAPTCTAEVPDFVEKHVHENYILTAGVKSLPVHRHVLHVDTPTILRKPPHTVHKVLKGGAGGGGGGGGGGATSSQTMTKRTRDRISSHPYKHAAAIASSRRTDGPSDDGGGDLTEGGSNKNLSSSSSIPSLFGAAGVIGGPEFDPYQKYRHEIYPFKEQLAHEVNILVLEKKNLDALRKRAAAAANRHQHDQDGEDIDDDENSSSYGDGSKTDTLIDEDDKCMLSSSSTLVDDDENIDEL